MKKGGGKGSDKCCTRTRGEGILFSKPAKRGAGGGMHTGGRAPFKEKGVKKGLGLGMKEGRGGRVVLGERRGSG